MPSRGWILGSTRLSAVDPGIDPVICGGSRDRPGELRRRDAARSLEAADMFLID